MQHLEVEMQKLKTYFLIVLSTLLFLTDTAQSDTHVALTPPIGWNSWDCCGMDPTSDDIGQTTYFMVKNLKKYGWEYVVLDMGWVYGDGLNTSNFDIKNSSQCIDSFGRMVPNLKKFPASKNGNRHKYLGDYIHSKELKFGIHTKRGIPRQAVELNTPITGTTYIAKDIASTKKLMKSVMSGINTLLHRIGLIRMNGPVDWFTKQIKVEASKTVNEFSRLCSDEKFSLMTLWSIFKSPLIIGGNLLDMDKPTLNLIMNKEVLEMNQTCINPSELKCTNVEMIWVTTEPVFNAKYAAVFNIEDKIIRNITLTLKELGIEGEIKFAI